MFKTFKSYQFRIFFILFAFLGVSFLALASLGQNLLNEVSEKERGNYLISFAKVLEAEIPDGGYDEIFLMLNLSDATKEEKLQALNEYLTPSSDYVSTFAPGLAVGYYILDDEFDTIANYGPSSSYSHLVGVRINDDHPAREAMRTNTTTVDKGQMVRGEILNAMQPIERNGKVIGYTWANQLAEYIDEEFSQTTNQVLLVLGLSFIIIFSLLGLFAWISIKEILTLMNGVENLRDGVIRRIPPINGKVGEIAQIINAMTEQGARNNVDSAKALITLQSVLDNLEEGIFICDTKKKEIVYANKYTQTKLHLNGILGETFAQTFYNSNDFSSSPCFNEVNEPNFDTHVREFYLDGIQKNVLISERLITWHDGRILLMLVISNLNK